MKRKDIRQILFINIATSCSVRMIFFPSVLSNMFTVIFLDFRYNKSNYLAERKVFFNWPQMLKTKIIKMSLQNISNSASSIQLCCCHRANTTPSTYKSKVD